MDAITENPAAIARFLRERFRRSKSWIPTPRPSPIIGPISGEMSMAPIITAVELVLRPSDAISIAITRITMFVPRKETPSRISFSASDCGTIYSERVKYDAK